MLHFPLLSFSNKYLHKNYIIEKKYKTSVTYACSSVDFEKKKKTGQHFEITVRTTEDIDTKKYWVLINVDLVAENSAILKYKHVKQIASIDTKI